MKDGGDAEPCLFEEEFLQAVGSFCRIDWIEGGCARHARDLPDAIFEFIGCFFPIQHTIRLQLVHPIGTNLGEFFVQGHLREVFFYALVNGFHSANL